MAMLSVTGDTGDATIQSLFSCITHPRIGRAATGWLAVDVLVPEPTATPSACTARCVGPLPCSTFGVAAANCSLRGVHEREDEDREVLVSAQEG